MYFFILSSGKCEVIIDGKSVKTLVAGNSFGELAIVHDSLRSATIQSVGNTLLWTIDRNSFKNAMKTISTNTYEARKAFIANISIFHNLSWDEKDALISSLVS
jgi:CRP-like cAMP-binding protein